MKVSFKYNEELKNYAKSLGGKWNAEEKVWEIPDDSYDDFKYKAMDLGVELETPSPASKTAGQERETAKASSNATAYRPAAAGAGMNTSTVGRSDTSRNAAAAQQSTLQGTAGSRNQGSIWLGRSRDGRYLIMKINLVAFSEDVQAVLDGTKKGAKFRVMMPRQQQGPNE